MEIKAKFSDEETYKDVMQALKEDAEENGISVEEYAAELLEAAIFGTEEEGEEANAGDEGKD